jgi:ketosteroid isomerase-like protein
VDAAADVARGERAARQGRFIAAWTHLVREWDYHRVEAEQVIDAPDGRVLVTARLTVRGRRSGAEIDHKGAGVYEITEGKISAITAYLDRAEALEAVGLRE